MLLLLHLTKSSPVLRAVWPMHCRGRQGPDLSHLLPVSPLSPALCHFRVGEKCTSKRLTGKDVPSGDFVLECCGLTSPRGQTPRPPSLRLAQAHAAGSTCRTPGGRPGHLPCALVSRSQTPSVPRAAVSRAASAWLGSWSGEQWVWL